MKTISLGLVAMMLSLTAAYADDNVLCVQQQLAAKGYNPGLLDGQLGASTRAAAQAAGVSGLGTLTTTNAAAWCQALGSTPRASLSTGSVSSSPFPRPRLCPRYVLDTDDPCF